MLCTIILLFSLQLFGIHEWDKEYVHDYRIGFVGHQPQYKSAVPLTCIHFG